MRVGGRFGNSDPAPARVFSAIASLERDGTIFAINAPCLAGDWKSHDESSHYGSPPSPEQRLAFGGVATWHCRFAEGVVAVHGTTSTQALPGADDGFGRSLGRHFHRRQDSRLRKIASRGRFASPRGNRPDHPARKPVIRDRHVVERGASLRARRSSSEQRAFIRSQAGRTVASDSARGIAVWERSRHRRAGARR